ncbi:MAG: hypothetical protein BHW55_00175 [Candidatus Melainabacteria bacterium 35_41]|nr:MAG: hypothetical protein BHW55_00175 [Candidatus Melainabacteria bacterium 35_41]
MKRIIIHWTAGTNQPNAHEKECYHFLIDSLGKVHNGIHKVEDNENCNDGSYAAHTGGGNTGSIGISMCGMAGFSSSKNVGKYPLTKVQCERCFKLIAELSKKYNILITPQTVMTHYEFGKAHPNATSAGKPDITFLPPFSYLSPNEIGSFIRNKAKWYLDK